MSALVHTTQSHFQSCINLPFQKINRELRLFLKSKRGLREDHKDRFQIVILCHFMIVMRKRGRSLGKIKVMYRHMMNG